MKIDFSSIKKDLDVIDHGWLGSSRFLLVVGFIAGLWFVHSIFDLATKIIAGSVIVAYLAFNSWTKTVASKGTTSLKLARIAKGLPENPDKSQGA